MSRPDPDILATAAHVLEGGEVHRAPTIDEASRLARFVQCVDSITRKMIADNEGVQDDEPEWHYLACAEEIRRRLCLPRPTPTKEGEG